jgi:hypothetical protein
VFESKYALGELAGEPHAAPVTKAGTATSSLMFCRQMELNEDAVALQNPTTSCLFLTDNVL